MAPRDRLSALKLIGRIKQHELESIGAELSALRNAQTDLERQSSDLSQQAADEASHSTSDTRPYLPAFLKSVDIKQQALTKESEALEDQARMAEAQLFAAFRETKTNEAVLGKVAKELALDQFRAETNILDDAGRTLYLQNRNGQNS
ncbi:MAG: hypothetical protein ACJAVM_002600 [Sulfitobacter sp.]|jgi:hypothetical protein